MTVISEKLAVEEIRSLDHLLAVIIRSALLPGTTTFITEARLPQQLGFVVYSSGGVVARHVHRPIKRELVGTSEVIIVRSGRCNVDLYDEARELVATRELVEGDVVVLVAGGHGFRMLEDTVLLEVKQGPYTGVDEKETF
jgi:hypothetical protein